MRILGLCSGNGVLLYPFKKYLVGAIEPRGIFHTKGNEQWIANFGEIPIYKNLIEHEQFRDNIDVIIGHPDCGHSSILSYSRKKTLSDPNENKSLNLFLNTCLYLNPKIWVMENLPNLLKMFPKEKFEKTFKDYRFIFITDSVKAWGNSQINRKRLLVIAIRKDVSSKVDKYLSNIYPVSEVKYSGMLIQGLIEGDKKSGNLREDVNKVITLYGGFKIPIVDVQTRWVGELSGSKRWTVKGENFDTAPGVYKNLEFDYPATARRANRQFNHKGEMMTPRELARIQGIPDEFKIFIGKDRQYWINKGRVNVTKTPPFEMGVWLYKQLIRSKLKGLI